MDTEKFLARLYRARYAIRWGLRFCYGNLIYYFEEWFEFYQNLVTAKPKSEPHPAPVWDPP